MFHQYYMHWNMFNLRVKASVPKSAGHTFDPHTFSISLTCLVFCWFSYPYKIIMVEQSIYVTRRVHFSGPYLDNHFLFSSAFTIRICRSQKFEEWCIIKRSAVDDGRSTRCVSEKMDFIITRLIPRYVIDMSRKNIFYPFHGITQSAIGSYSMEIVEYILFYFVKRVGQNYE